jgi:lysophospholipase L1-like esterase
VLLGACDSPIGSVAGSGAHPAAPPHYSLTYVALGASDGFGVGTYDPDRDNWPTVLAGKLGSSIHLINLGIPEATVAVAQQEELPVALDAHPGLVTIWLAVNDLADNVPLATYRQQLRSLLHDLRIGTRARIFVGNIPDLTLLPYFHYAGYDPASLRSEVQQWNAAIAADCAAEGASVVDLYSGWSELAQHPEYIAVDGMHPSSVGALRLAQIFAAAIHQVSPASSAGGA